MGLLFIYTLLHEIQEELTLIELNRLILDNHDSVKNKIEVLGKKKKFGRQLSIVNHVKGPQAVQLST